MGVPGLARTRLAGEDSGERASGLVAGFVGGGAGGQALQRGLDCGKIVEGVEAICAAAELTWGLWAAEHEKTEDGGLVTAQVKDGADAVLVLGDAGVVDRSDKSEVFKGMESLPDFFFGEIEDRVATRTLVACVEQGVERERIVLGRGDLLFNEGAEDAELGGVKLLHIH
jgi:hypothetical protein